MQGGASNALRELTALTNRQIWLTLAMGARGLVACLESMLIWPLHWKILPICLPELFL